MEQQWMNDIQWEDVTRPLESLGEEEIYTLRMGDFLQMPDVDFVALSSYDPHIRALMN
jgi:hypothetical protein